MDDADEYANPPLSYAKLRVIEMAYHRYLQQKKQSKPNPHIMTSTFVIMLSGIFLIYIELAQMEVCDPEGAGGSAIDECEWEKFVFKLKWGGLLVAIVSLIFIGWRILVENYKNAMHPKLEILAEISQMPPSKYDQLGLWDMRESRVLRHVESILNQD